MPEEVNEKSTTGELPVEALEVKLAECEAKKDEYLDGWQRSRAEIQNESKKFMEQMQMISKRSIQSTIEDLLPIFDSLNLAHDSVAQDDTSSIAVGLKNIKTQMGHVLGSLSVEEYGDVDDTFSPHMHESIEQIEVETESEVNKILEVVRKGYKLENTIIRPAQVKVGTLAKSPKKE